MLSIKKNIVYVMLRKLVENEYAWYFFTQQQR